MLAILAKNPVFAANPECLAGFVESLVQPRQQSIPTPMSKAMDTSTGVKQEDSSVQPSMHVKREGSAMEDSQSSMAPVQRGESEAEDSQATIEARKQFWAKFKRLRPADPQFSPEPPSPAPTAAASPAETDYGDNGKSELKLCALPTMILGEESIDSPGGGSSEVAKTLPGNGASSEVETVSTDGVQAKGESTSQPAGGEACASNPEEAKDVATTEEAKDVAITLPDPSPGSPVVASQGEVPEPILVESPKMGKGEAEPKAPEDTTRADVAEALKRVNTVDLNNGQTPAPPQSLVSVPDPPVSTVVLLDVGGVVQPVTVPLSPHQCRLAGMTIANDPDAPALDPSKKADPDTPAQLEQKVPEGPIGEGESDMSEKQMLKNIYMRFSRSQKRARIAIPGC